MVDSTLKEILWRNRLGHAMQVQDKLALRRGRIPTWFGPEYRTRKTKCSVAFKVLHEEEPVYNTIGFKIRGIKTTYNTASFKIRGLLSNWIRDNKYTIAWKIKGAKQERLTLAYTIKYYNRITKCSLAFQISNKLISYNTLGFRILNYGTNESRVCNTIAFKIKGEKRYFNTLAFKILGATKTFNTIGFKVSNAVAPEYMTIGFKIKNTDRQYTTVGFKINKGIKLYTDALFLTESQNSNEYFQSLLSSFLENYNLEYGTTLSLTYGVPKVYSNDATPIQYTLDTDFTWDGQTHQIQRIIGGGIGAVDEVDIVYGLDYSNTDENIVIDSAYMPFISNLTVKNMDGTVTYTDGVDYTFDTENFTVTLISTGNIDSRQFVEMTYGTSSQFSERNMINNGHKLMQVPYFYDINLFTDDGFFLINGEHYIYTPSNTNIEWTELGYSLFGG